MFTINRMLAAPVIVSREHLELAQPQAVVTNSGVANAATGERGLLDARATAAETARLLGLDTEEVLVLSTGVIGAQLPLANVTAGVRAAAAALSADGGADSAQAIMTTDTQSKEAVAHGAGFAVGGMAKGSGMIHPQLATMLAVVTTDYPLDAGEAIEFLRPAVDTSFNAISVDGECSTNDTVILLANGASGIERTPASDEEFALCIRKVCGELAKLIVTDGEGATVLAEIAVRGAASEPEARAIAERVATSPLVKTALYGHDANWGRIAAAAGSAKFNGGFAQLDPDTLSISIDGVAGARRRTAVGRRARPDERALRDRARPRDRRRHRELPDDRSLVRLRAHQRGVPDVSVVVLKVGGASTGGVAEAVADLRAAGNQVCVVHGAGPQISEEMERRGLEPHFVGGRRVTTPEVLEVVCESFAEVNAAVCAAIGADAVGLFGDEIGLARGARARARARRPGRSFRAAHRARRARLRPRAGRLAAGAGPAERQRRRGRGRARRRHRRCADPLPHRRARRLPRRRARRVDQRRACRDARRLGLVRGRDRPEGARRGARGAQRARRGDRRRRRSPHEHGAAQRAAADVPADARRRSSTATASG